MTAQKQHEKIKKTWEDLKEIPQKENREDNTKTPKLSNSTNSKLSLDLNNLSIWEAYSLANLLLILYNLHFIPEDLYREKYEKFVEEFIGVGEGL